MNHTPKHFKRFAFSIYTHAKDKWIGHFSKDFTGQDSGCKFVETTHFICIIPCIVFEFQTKRYTSHEKRCWHKRKK